ncbi:hypothetical protein [Allostreptomyces psammosilenae]|uniref:Uncharacterized protein n=1 Tax=Allostreptomyces psammosilenae TaxID=1892865 RepID=A0A853A0Y7_9ACTN|nr:hypothetical protein [Allostreptomyces psammosilenae]NYI07807.1 hypothetical protein [Allostreptomyces psammosilenae]
MSFSQAESPLGYRPANYESLNFADAETGRTIHTAGGVFWLDGGRWWVGEGFLDYCDQEGVDPLVESGFGYCLSPYRFGQEFTPEAVVRAGLARWWGDDEEAALAAVREVFSRHG